MKMKEIKEKYLPIGTVVLLKNAIKRIMIIGFCSRERNDSDSKIYDYCGCLYPEGLLTSDRALLFDHKKIEKIYHIGLSNDDEEKQFKKNLKMAMEEFEKYNKTINEVVSAIINTSELVLYITPTKYLCPFIVFISIKVPSLSIQ